MHIYHVDRKSGLRWKIPTVLVPLRPTKRMLSAACDALSPLNRPTQEWVGTKDKHRIRWAAMLAAAPKIYGDP